MSPIGTEAPADPAAFRRALYDGEIFLLPATPASLELVDLARARLVEALGEAPRLAHERADHFERVGRLRRAIYEDPSFHQASLEVAAAWGLDPADFALDPARIRAVSHDGHHVPAAAPVYYAHRDTWYGHSQALLNWWIPLDDLSEEETFWFYPERFARAVPNDSEIFDYGAWSRSGLTIGWQRRDAGFEPRYPRMAPGADPGVALGFSCRAGQTLVFSGSHLHGTRPQSLGTTRYSLDFRLVHLGDHEAGRGAPAVDDRSRGCALVDYRYPKVSA